MHVDHHVKHLLVWFEWRFSISNERLEDGFSFIESVPLSKHIQCNPTLVKLTMKNNKNQEHIIPMEGKEVNLNKYFEHNLIC